jgi:hypothetical protein
MAAGSLLTRSRRTGRHWRRNGSTWTTGNLIAGNPKIFSQLLQLIGQHKTAALAA